jgi:hypothetical protein
MFLCRLQKEQLRKMLRTKSVSNPADNNRMEYAAKVLQDALKAKLPELRELARNGDCPALLACVRAALTKFLEAFVGRYSRVLRRPLIVKLRAGFNNLRGKLGEAHMEVSCWGGLGLQCIWPTLHCLYVSAAIIHSRGT